MKDIFISHSSKDVNYAKEIYKRFVEEGYSCWASFEFEDIKPGDNYTKNIPAAINSCKVFVLLVSFNSYQSDQVENELVIANNKKKYGLKLLGIIIDDNVDIDFLGGGFEYVFAARQLGHWDDLKYQNALLSVIHDCIVPKKKHINASIINQIPSNEFFIGRSEEILKIKKLIKDNGKVCIHGMGGIGKTALIKKICIELYEQKEYQNVIYIPVINGLLRALADDRNLLIQTEDLDEVKEQSDYAYGYYKLSVLESGIEGKTLVVFDNLESEEDPLFSRVIALPYDMVICCRNLAMEKYMAISFYIGEIKENEIIREIFEENYGRVLTEQEKCDAEKLFHSVKNHTLTIGLLGRQFKYYGYTPSEYIKDGGLFTDKKGRINQKNHHGIYEQLYELFDAKSLKDDEIAVMKAMCFIPEAGVPGHIIEELSGQECIEEIQELKRKGWIQQDNQTMYVSLHPVVKEIVLSELGVTIEDKDIQVFTNNLIASIDNSWDKPEEKLLPFKELALAYYFRFQSPTISRFNQYLIFAKYFWVVNCPDLGIEIMDKVKQLFILANGSHMNTSQEAEALLQIGFIFQGKGDYRAAEENLSLAARIFGNKYGAALSHLAQAKMSAKSAVIEEIEPLLLESLQIREKYWSGTLSEANSYHLYAKVLSEFQYKLEDALQYEKKADRFFSLNQPGGRNESSSKYMLGWLVIQLSDGDEDLFDHGLSLLEKGKSIRIKHVGRYGIWMEDIYRKLGMAYMMKNDLNKAAYYFEELLEVAKEKYSTDKSNPVIIEAHKYLERLYTLLGDEKKAHRSQKYLRIYG